ncbi:MAG: SCO family protein [Pseudomonadota bacterium]|nr:SCO family protein [Pseudomonadota bacterium]QKK05349.1 MAG: SCO family protein [Pseudomonadota bacterium]
MKQEQQQLILGFLMLAAVCAGVIAFVALRPASQNALSPSLSQSQGSQQSATDLRVAVRPNVDYGGDFTMLDHNGATVTQDSWPGKYKLLFFGFSHCPDICVGAVVKIGDVLEKLPAETAAQIAPLFVTADPVRDTPEVMKAFLADFDSAIIGLTGSEEQAEHLIKLFRVYAKKTENADAEGGYVIDHSSYFYLLSPDGKLAMFRESDRAEDIAHDLAVLIDGSQSSK